MEIEDDVRRTVWEDDTNVLLEPAEEEVGFTLHSVDCQTKLLAMNPSSLIYFRGSFRVRCLAGSVEIFGYFLKPKMEPVDVHSIDGSSALYLKTFNIKSEEDRDVSMLTEMGFSPLQASVVISRAAVGGCILELTPPTDSRFSEVKPPKLWFQPEGHYRGVGTKTTIAPQITDFELCEGVTVVCGGLGTGKSTCLRYLTNRFLSRRGAVLYLDMDIGQPEFTLQECVSAVLVKEPLLGPSYTHHRRAIHSFHVGHIDASRRVEAYVKAVTLLVDRCRSEYSHLPWLINTMGFTRGVGIYLNSMCISLVKPDRVLQIDGEASSNFPSLLTPTYVNSQTGSPGVSYDLIEVPARNSYSKNIKRSSTHSNKVIRSLSTQYYFSNPLRPSYPVSVPLDCVELVDVLGDNIIPPELAGNLVSKIVILGNREQSSNGPAKVLDHGVVLAHVPDNNSLMILAPLEPEHFVSISSILVSSLQLPSRLAMAVSPHVSGQLPFCQLGNYSSLSSAPTLKPLKRTFRFLFEPTSQQKSSKPSLPES